MGYRQFPDIEYPEFELEIENVEPEFVTFWIHGGADGSESVRLDTASVTGLGKHLIEVGMARQHG